MEIAQSIYLRHHQGWCKRHINGRHFQSVVCPRSNHLWSTLWTNTRGIPQRVMDNPCHTHCVPIYTESGLGCPRVIHHNMSTVYDIALVGVMVRLKLMPLQQQTWNPDM